MTHILVVEELLGRRLLEGETVHHRNGIRHDNRPENLELWVKPQPSGIRGVDAADWAIEVLRRIGRRLHPQQRSDAIRALLEVAGIEPASFDLAPGASPGAAADLNLGSLARDDALEVTQPGKCSLRYPDAPGG